jgi:hypothetical protein
VRQSPGPQSVWDCKLPQSLGTFQVDRGRRPQDRADHHPIIGGDLGEPWSIGKPWLDRGSGLLRLQKSPSLTAVESWPSTVAFHDHLAVSRNVSFRRMRCRPDIRDETDKTLALIVAHALLAVLARLSGVFALVLNRHRPS